MRSRAIRDADEITILVVDRGNHNLKDHVAGVLTDTLRLKYLDRPGVLDLVDLLKQLLKVLGQREGSQRFADRLGRRIAIEVLGGFVPAGDLHIEIYGDDRVVRGLDDRGQEVFVQIVVWHQFGATSRKRTSNWESPN